MSKMVSLKKLAHMAKGGESKGATLVAKGITIGEKHPWKEMVDILPIKKSK